MPRLGSDDLAQEYLGCLPSIPGVFVSFFIFRPCRGRTWDLEERLEGAQTDMIHISLEAAVNWGVDVNPEGGWLVS